MLGAIASIILGIVAWMGDIPVVLPVFGLILGLNGLMKEKNRTEKHKNILMMCWAGIVLNSISTALVIMGGLIRR